MILETKVQVKFTVETGRGAFKDALYFTEAEYAEKTVEDIEAAAQARADSWVAQVILASAQE